MLGPPGRVFYVSDKSVFVWTTAWRGTGAASAERALGACSASRSTASAPSALKAAGSPIDQFSFLEGEDGYLNVLVRAKRRGRRHVGGRDACGGQLALHARAR